MDGPLLQMLLGALTAALTGFLAQRIQGRYWVAQERWHMKSRYYAALLRILEELLSAYQECARLESREAADAKADERRAAALDEVKRLHARVRRLVAVAELWIPPEMFHQIFEFEMHVSTRTQGDTRQWDSAISGAMLLRADILQMARRDLRLSLKGT